MVIPQSQIKSDKYGGGSGLLTHPPNPSIQCTGVRVEEEGLQPDDDDVDFRATRQRFGGIHP